MSSSSRRKGRSRRYVFTDYKKIDFKKVYEAQTKQIRYIAWGQEVCPESGRHHQQGWVQFHNAKTLAAAKKCLGDRSLHLETAKGSVAENEAYVSKEDTSPVCLGELPVQGTRSDLETVRAAIAKGSSDLQVANAHFGTWVRYQKSFAKYRSLTESANAEAFRHVSVVLLAGRTGSGKTRYAAKYAGFLIQADQIGKWWDGYEGQRVICIDEYNNNVPITTLLTLLDGYRHRLPLKGSFTYAQWTTVFITTNLRELHLNASEAHRLALCRRITTVITAHGDDEVI